MINPFLQLELITNDKYDSVMEEPMDLLTGGENNLALYDLTAKASAENEYAFYTSFERDLTTKKHFS